MPQRPPTSDRPEMDERVEELQRVVSLLVYKMDKDFGVPLDFTPSSMPYLDAVIAEARRKGSGMAPGLYLSIGGYLGETLVRNFGGTWEDIDGKLCVGLAGQGHTRFIHVFDWVHEAYDDPRTHSLTYRMQTLGSGHLQNWSTGGGQDAATA